MRSEIDAGDIQAIAKSGFGKIKAARYLLLRVAERDAARHWLRSITPASVAQLPAEESPHTVSLPFSCPHNALQAGSLGLSK